MRNCLLMLDSLFSWLSELKGDLDKAAWDSMSHGHEITAIRADLERAPEPRRASPADRGPC
jgi:hypothetical protein